MEFLGRLRELLFEAIEAAFDKDKALTILLASKAGIPHSVLRKEFSSIINLRYPIYLSGPEWLRQDSILDGFPDAAHYFSLIMQHRRSLSLSF